jgi:murein DD-endopeptidase MepM/ murein hydrolase activator NlpD
MSLSIIYRGRKVKFNWSLSQRRLLAVAGVGAFLLASYHQPWNSDGMDPEMAQSQISEEQRALAMQSDAVKEVRRRTQQELTAMTMKVGEMQAQLLRLEALGQRLAEHANVDDAEFNFSQPMPVGGPEYAASDWPTVDDHDVLNDLDSMLGELADKQKQLRLLESVMINHHIDDERQIAGRPVLESWPSSAFGIRKDPFTGSPRMHKGMDFASADGNEIVATGAGIVTFADHRSGYGKLVEIDHGGGLRTRYAHTKRIDVKVGDVVTRGQPIAAVGSTGRSTGPHVHYEVLRNGQAIDPGEFVQRRPTSE